jgi:G3E family GTPase
LLSGFLGSGKTTLVNALLQDPRLAETAVAINEFGEVPLDQILLGHDRDATVVMANGCLCCNLAGDMEDAVMRIFSRRKAGELPAFKRLIVEPSGLADPAPIAQAILRNPVMSRALRLAGIVTTVDALCATTQRANHLEFARQVSIADTVVLTKCDLAAPREVALVMASVGDLNPPARLLQAEHGAIEAAGWLPACFVDAAAPDDAPPRTLREPTNGHDHSAQVASLCLTTTQPLRWRAFDDWLRGIRLSLGEDMLRVKGILHVAESDRPVVVQGVHHVLHPPVLRDAWPDEDRQTRLVLILQAPHAARVAASWEAWLADEPR